MTVGPLRCSARLRVAEMYERPKVIVDPHFRAMGDVFSAEDARRLGIAPGDEVEVRAGDALVRATARLRDGLPVGSVFLVQGTDEQSATALTNGVVPVVEVSKA